MLEPFTPSVIDMSERVPANLAGNRLDAIAVELFPEYSRARLQAWIKEGALTVNGRTLKPNAKLSGGELLELKAQHEAQGEWVPQDLLLDVEYEDDDIIVINKAPGMVVHPGAGNHDGTLLNGLIYHYPELLQIPRAGIVHRLDKDTSGLMVVARNLAAQMSLVNQLQARTVSRVYEAVVHGVPQMQGSIEENIGRDSSNRLKMAVVLGSKSGKPAKTHYQRLSHTTHFAHMRLKLETGRTHQIRVHMAHLGFPLVGDPVYGRSVNRALLRQYHDYEQINNFPRQALHAARLGLVHPADGRNCQWRVPLPSDFEELLDWVFCE